MITTITIPKDLNSNSAAGVSLHDYHSHQEMDRQQVILNRHTFSFLRQGMKDVVFNAKAYSIDNSSFLLMKAGNCLMSEHINSSNDSYQSLLFFFSDDDILHFIQSRQIAMKQVRDSQGVHLFDYDQFTKDFINSLFTLSKMPADIQQTLLPVKLQEILSYLVLKYGIAFLLDMLQKNQDPKQKFIRTVESNRLNKLTLNQLAFLCDMSVSTFKREFEKQYGQSPSRWFQDQRLTNAHQLLLSGHKRPTEIYLEAGYENLSSFVQAYKMKYGITPGQQQPA